MRHPRLHAILLDPSSSTPPREDSVHCSPTTLWKDRVSVRPHFMQNIQEGDHVRVPTTHVEPGSSSIGPNLPGPMKEPWPSAGGYKYPLLPEGQVFIILTSNLLLSARTPTYFSIEVPCRYPPPPRSKLQLGASRDGPSLIRLDQWHRLWETSFPVLTNNSKDQSSYSTTCHG